VKCIVKFSWLLKYVLFGNFFETMNKRHGMNIHASYLQ